MFRPTHLASTLPAMPPRRARASAVRVTPSGRHVLVSNRGHDSIALLRFDEGAGTLTLAETEPSQGEQPRDFAIARTASFIVAQQDSDLLVSYQLTKALPRTRRAPPAVARTPACLVFGEIPIDRVRRATDRPDSRGGIGTGRKGIDLPLIEPTRLGLRIPSQEPSITPPRKPPMTPEGLGGVGLSGG